MQEKIRTDLEKQDYIYQECCNRDRFFNLSLDMLAIANLEGYFRNINPAWERILGFTVEELSSQPYQEFVHPEDWVKTKVEMGKLAEGIPVTDFENRYRCKDNSYKYLAWTAFPFLEEGLVYAVARDVTQFKQTEAALRENQRLLQEVVDAAPMDIFLKDLQGKYLLINHSGEKTAGLSREQVIGKTDYDLFPTEIADTFRDNDFAVLQAGKPIESEEVVPQADGLHTVIAIKFPLYDSSGEPYAVCGIATDITGRKRMEEALYQREQSFRALAENSPDIIFRIDKQMRHLYVNAAVEPVTGISPCSFIGKTHQELGMSEKMCTESQENLQYVFSTGCERIVEFDFLTPQGTIRNYQTRLVPEFALNGSIESILGVSRDVTQFKQTEKALRESQQLLQALLDAAPMAIYLKDLQGRYLLCNRYSLASFNLNSQEVIGKTLYDFFPEEIADLFQVSDRAALEAGSPVELEEVLPQSDGLHTYITTKFPLYDAANNPSSICGISVDITGRKLAETALTESEERFRQLAENIEAIFWVCSLDGTQMLYVSPAYEKIWGCSTRSLYENPQSWQKAIHPEDLPQVQAAMEQHRQGKFPEREYRIMQPDGSIRWIQDRIFPVSNSQGKVYRLCGIAQDITERKLAEKALTESEERFRQLAENIDAVFWVCSLDEPKILYISPAYEKIWGCSTQSLYKNPQSFIDAIHPEDLPQIFSKRQQLIQGECIEDIYRIIKPDNSVSWIHDRAFPIYNSQGKLYRTAGIAEDITERKLAEAALTESEKRFRQLAENIDAVVWMWSLDDQQTLYVSPAYEKIWGRSSKLVFESFQNWLDTIHPEDQDKMSHIMYKRLIQGDFVEETYRIIKPDNSVRWIHDRAFPIYNSQGRMYRAAGISEDITERKLAETALTESEERFRELAENIDAVFWVHSLDENKILYVSPAYEKIWGRTTQSLYENPLSWHDAIHPEDLPLMQAAMERNRRQGEFPETEYRIVQPNNSIRWMQDRIFPVRNSQGRVYRLAGIVQDITERKLAEIALTESEERFRQLAENMDAVVWICSLDEQKTLYISPAYERIWGRSSKLLFENSQNWLDTIHPEDRDQVATIMYQRLIEGYLVEETYRIIKPDNSVRWIHDRAFPVYNSQGKIYRAAGIAEDITERIMTEAALKESEQKYRQLIETSQGIIWSVNTEGILTFVNPAALKLYGYEAAEVIGKNFWNFTSKKPTQQDRERFQQFLTSDSIIQYEAEWIHKSGTQFYLSCNLMALRDDTGKILGITGTAVDITERKKAEEQLKLSLQEKEALLKEVHHRVKNNLQVISSLLDLQSQQIQDPLTLDVFRASQNRVKSIALIHEKLYQSDNLARVNLAEYIQSLTAYLLQTYPIDPNNISLELKVKQIFLNLDIVIPCGLIINELVSNALKHGFPGNTKGTIWICLNSVCLESPKKQGQQFTLVIGNNGMKLEDHQKFYRPKSLGFQLVNALVKQLQGIIEITSSPGTEFKIKFSEFNH